MARPFRIRSRRSARCLVALVASVVSAACAGAADEISAQLAPGVHATAEAVGAGAFRVSITPTGDSARGRQSQRLSQPGAVLQLDPGDGTIALRATDERTPRWVGCITLLDQFGRAGVAGLELSWRAAEDEAIFGLGQRFNDLDQNGRTCEMWILDAVGGGAEQQASYFCTPVLYSSRGYGLFATDNPEGVFDFNSDNSGRHRYRRAGRALSFYLVVGDTLRDLVLERGRLQGPFRGIPDWSWGPWISRNSYETQDEAEAALRGMMERQWPVAAIVQEAWKGPSETGDYNNFSKDRWPRLSYYLRLCAAHDIRTILWQVPILHPSSPHYATLRSFAGYVTRPDGEPSLRQHWMNGFANLDFTNPQTVAFWKDLLRDEVRLGIAGFKADDGEDIKATDVFFDGRRGWQLHNEYSVLYNQALTDLLDEENADGLLWARSGSLGIERTPALWAGDQLSTWPQLRSLLPAGLSTGLSGMPFWGHDIGGYAGTPTPELYIRWLEFGTFSPLMQYHGNTPREPWEFGYEAEQAYRRLSYLRMALVPTLIELGRAAAATGLPIMRPMALEFPNDERFAREQTQYMLGPDLLVAPVLEPGATGRDVAFPDGQWQHISHPVAYVGPADYYVPAPLGTPPVFVRSGAALTVRATKARPPLEWTEKAPQRQVTYRPDRPAIYNLQIPAFADALHGDALVTFELADEDTRPLVLCTAPGAASGFTLVDVAQSGRRCSFGLPRAGVTSLAGKTQRFLIQQAGAGPRTIISTGSVRWEVPLDVGLDTTGSRLAPGLTTTVRTHLHNRSEREASLTMTAAADPALAVAPVEQTVHIAGHAQESLSWNVTMSDDNAVASGQVSFIARHDTTELLSATATFAPPWRWVAVGPFPGRRATMHWSPLGPEWRADADVAYRADGQTLRWQRVPVSNSSTHPGVNFDKLFGYTEHAVAYGMTRLRSDRTQPVELHFGSDDTLAVWLNGRQIYSVETYRAAAPDQERVAAELKVGVNTLLVKVAQDVGGWELFARISGPDDTPLAGVSDGFDDMAAFDADRAPAMIIESVLPPPWRIAGPIAPDAIAAAELANATIAGPWPPKVIRGPWREMSAAARRDGLIDLRDLLGNEADVAAIAVSHVNVPVATDVELVCGSDDGLVLWLNGEKLIDAPEPRGFQFDTHRVRSRLRAGENRLLAMILQVGGDWQFCATLWNVSQQPPCPLIGTSGNAPAAAEDH